MKVAVSNIVHFLLRSLRGVEVEEKLRMRWGVSKATDVEATNVGNEATDLSNEATNVGNRCGQDCRAISSRSRKRKRVIAHRSELEISAEIEREMIGAETIRAFVKPYQRDEEKNPNHPQNLNPSHWHSSNDSWQQGRPPLLGLNPLALIPAHGGSITGELPWLQEEEGSTNLKLPKLKESGDDFHSNLVVESLPTSCIKNRAQGDETGGEIECADIWEFKED
ncbi:hypothetical protein SESBI_01326, partial [Sesbania bispinosa]